jgi:glycosyltransferase involved in cell wall biosynthesis
LLSVYPASNAGTTTYVRGLLAGLRGDEALEIVALTNTALGEACRDFANGRVAIQGSARYAVIERRFGRVPALCLTSTLSMISAAEIQDVDVIHYPQTVRSPRVGRPAVVTLHDVQHLDLPQLFSPAVKAWRRLMYDDSARRADAVITVSEHARARIVDRLDIDPARVHVSHHGVDTNLFSPEMAANDAEIRHRVGVREPYLYYPASLAPHKNHRALFQALSLLKGRRLVLTGPHANRLDELLAEARACGVDDRVQHLGMIATEDLPALYRGASCLVFPSLYEGFGVPIVEAMASACPVACSDQGAPVEVAGGAARVFDPRQPEAIARAIETLEDPAVRNRCVRDGLARAEQFTWARVAQRHRRVYESIADV